MKEKYLELEEIANRIESIRIELWQSSEHEKCMGDAEEKDYIDNKLFSIQSQLKDVVEFCQVGII